MKIKPKHKKDSVKAFLLQKVTDQWVKENPELFDDIKELAERIHTFNLLHGTNLTLKYTDE